MSKKRILLVVDLQKQFRDKDGQYDKCLQYINDHKGEYHRIIGTVFRNHDASMYEKHLGWSSCKDVTLSDIEYEYDEIIWKCGYSANINDAFSCIVDKYCGEFSPTPCTVSFDIIGCDADACVLATAFALWDRRYDFNILSDYIYTTAHDIKKEDILKIMKRNFGECVR